METTLILFKIWGWYMLTMGIIIALRGDLKYKLIEAFKEDSNQIVLSIFLILGGIIHVVLHDIWTSWQSVVVTLFGYLMLLKGIAFLLTQSTMSELAEEILKSKVFPILIIGVAATGLFMLGVGYGYLFQTN